MVTVREVIPLVEQEPDVRVTLTLTPAHQRTG
jgi:hypothetical protein